MKVLASYISISISCVSCTPLSHKSSLCCIFSSFYKKKRKKVGAGVRTPNYTFCLCFSAADKVSSCTLSYIYFSMAKRKSRVFDFFLSFKVHFKGNCQVLVKGGNSFQSFINEIRFSYNVTLKCWCFMVHQQTYYTVTVIIW